MTNEQLKVAKVGDTFTPMHGSYPCVMVVSMVRHSRAGTVYLLAEFDRSHQRFFHPSEIASHQSN